MKEKGKPRQDVCKDCIHQNSCTTAKLYTDLIACSNHKRMGQGNLKESAYSERKECDEMCYIEEDGEVVMNKKCLDCDYSEVDNIFHELTCKLRNLK